MFSASGDVDKGRRTEDDFMQAGDVCFSGSGHMWSWKSYMTPYCLLESRPRIFCPLLQTLGGRKLAQVEGGTEGVDVNVHLQLLPGGSSDPAYWLYFLSLYFTQTWEVGLSIEGFLPSSWSGALSPLNTDVGLSPLWVASLLGKWPWFVFKSWLRKPWRASQ